MWIVGRQLHHAYAAAIACHPAGSACLRRRGQQLQRHEPRSLEGGYLLQPVPALIGAFVGAPVLARELETGTFRYAWTQGFGRWRWTLAKLVGLALAVTVVAGAIGVLFSWYYQPYFAPGTRAYSLRAGPRSRRSVRPPRGGVRCLDAGRLRDRRPGGRAHPPGRPRDRRNPRRLHRPRDRSFDVPAPALPSAAGQQQRQRPRAAWSGQWWTKGGKSAFGRS